MTKKEMLALKYWSNGYGDCPHRNTNDSLERKHLIEWDGDGYNVTKQGWEVIEKDGAQETDNPSVG